MRIMFGGGLFGKEGDMSFYFRKKDRGHNKRDEKKQKDNTY